jgi:group I intron endonuclease
MSGTIYIARSKTSGKCYVGKTTIPIEKRIAQHVQAKGYVFHSALAKYGRSDFEWTTIENVPEEFLAEWERFFIDKLNTVVPCGYNLKNGSEGHRQSEETKKKIADKNAGKKRRPLSEAHRKQISERMKGHPSWTKGMKLPCSEETKRKISLAKKGRISSSEERRKNSESHKGKTPWNKGISTGPRTDIVWNKGKHLPQEMLDRRKKRLALRKELQRVI